MWPVSERFLEALKYPHEVATSVTVTPPGGEPLELDLLSGQVKVDGTARLRRGGSLAVQGNSDVYDAVCAPGAELEILHGIKFGADRELVPVFTGEVRSGSQSLGTGEISFALQDMQARVERARFLTPRAPTGSRIAVIQNLVSEARPGTTFADSATDTGTVQSAVWDESRSDCVRDLLRDGSTEGFFAADGSYALRPERTLASEAVWTISGGEAGLITSASRERPMDRLYNTVVGRPTASDGSQTWPQQVAQITDVTHPRHPSKVGVVPYFLPLPTAKTAAAALRACLTMLDRVAGTTETLSLGAISNPALEANEPIRIITPAMESESAHIFQHFIDSFDLDLMTGGMTLKTRSQVDV